MQPRPWPSLHHVTIGRTREVRGPDAMERAATGVIIAVVMTMAVCFGRHTVHMVETLDAVSLASGAKVDQTVFYATHGHWPTSNASNLTNGRATSRHVKQLVLEGNGVITAKLTLGPGLGVAATPAATSARATQDYLSFRPEMLGSPDAPLIMYLCGYAKPVAGAAANVAAGRTTVRRNDLPPFCR